MSNLLKPKKSGSALVLIMLAIVVLLVTGAALLSLGTQSYLLAVRTSSEITARCAADAGLTKAVFEMNNKLKTKPWVESPLPSATNQTLPNCDAILSYSVTGNGGSAYIIESVGKSGRAEKKIRAALQLKGPFDFAVFVKNTLELKNGTYVDWYNHDPDDENFQIGTNSIKAASMIMKTGVTVYGDVVVGVGGDPNTVINSKKLAKITGQTYAMTEKRELPIVTVPAHVKLLPSGGTISGSTTITNSVKYTSINLSGGQIITIDKPVTLYVPGDIILDNSAQLQISNSNNASLTLYLGGNFISKNGGAINNLSKDSKKLKIYGLDNCLSVDFRTAGDFYGAIYAPNADVLSHNSVQVFGSIAANSFIQDVAANLHYDASLKHVSPNDELVRFAVKQWHEE